MTVRAQLAGTFDTGSSAILAMSDGLGLCELRESADFTRARKLSPQPHQKPREAEHPRHFAKASANAPTPLHALIEAPPTAGLVHAYLIDADDERRAMLHKLLSGRSNMVVRAYRTRMAFLADADMLDEGCVILSGETADEGADEDEKLLTFIRQSRDNGRFACVMLADSQHMRLAIDAMKAGAVDCLLAPYASENLISVVDDALMLIRATREESAVSAEARGQINRLTARERDVLHGLLHGKSNKMIALDLGISPRTVEIYRAHLMDKLGTHSLSETLKVAFAAGMA